jgi:hypothetical protein
MWAFFMSAPWGTGGALTANNPANSQSYLFINFQFSNYNQVGRLANIQLDFQTYACSNKKDKS